MKMVSVYPAVECNSNYNPDTANNGGGYSQPCGGATFLVNADIIGVMVEDASCGDFGSRVFYTVIAPNHTWEWCEGTMQDACVDSQNVIDDILASIAGCLNVNPCELLSIALSAL